MGLQIVTAILLWFPFLAGLVLTFIPFVTLWIYRILITVLLRLLFRKDLIEPMTFPDAAYGTSDIQVWQQPRSSGGFVHILERPIPLEALQHRLTQVILGKVPIDGQQSLLNYERLTSIYPTTWLGYPFWTKGPNPFDIRKHIKTVSLSNSTGTVAGIVTKWATSFFELNRPLWDVLFISDFLDEKGERRCLFGFRIHHMIGDGYSMLGFLQKVFDQDLHIAPPPPRHQPMTLTEKLKMWGCLPMTLWTNLQICFHSDYFTTRKHNREILWAKVSVDLSELKAVRKRLSCAVGSPVTMATVILFLFGNSLRKVLPRGNSGKKPLDNTLDTLKVLIAMPRAKPHPQGTFTNHWGHVLMEVPLKESSPSVRLKRMVSNSGWLGASGAAEMNAKVFSKVYTPLPRFVSNFIAQNVCGSTILAANLPGPPHSVSINGTKVLEKYLVPGLQLRHTSFALGCFSYNDRMAISMIANQEVFEDAIAQKILNQFREEVAIHSSNDIKII